MMAIGAIIAVLASAILLVLVINSDKKWPFFIAIFILIGAIMMFCFKNYAYQAFQTYGSAFSVTIDKAKEASSVGCIISGIAMIGGAIFQAIAALVDRY